MTQERDNRKYAKNSIIGAGLFTGLTVYVTFLKILGGFLSLTLIDTTFGTSAQVEFYWDELSYTYTFLSTGIRYSDASLLEIQSVVEFIWFLIPIWGYIFLVGGIAGATLTAYRGFNEFGMLSETKKPLHLYGLIIGLFSSGVEYLLFILLWFFEDWGSDPPTPNIVIFLCFLLGWIALAVGYKMANKIDPTPSTMRPMTSELVKTDPETRVKSCPNCSNQIKEFASFCEICGQKISKK